MGGELERRAGFDDRETIRVLRMKVRDLEAWEKVAVDANKALTAYLLEIYPELPVPYGMPVDGVMQVVRYLHTQLWSVTDLDSGLSCLTNDGGVLRPYRVETAINRLRHEKQEAS